MFLQGFNFVQKIGSDEAASFITIIKYEIINIKSYLQFPYFRTLLKK